MERPRIFLKTVTTNETDYSTIVDIAISHDARGISYFSMAIDPDPKALYLIIIGNFLYEIDLELTAVWKLELPHLTFGIYSGFKAGDRIIVKHKTTDPNTAVKSSATVAFNEVIG